MKTSFLFMLIVAITTAVQAQNSPQDYIDAHNQARAAVGVGPVSWDQNVTDYAQNYANERAEDCQLIHSSGPYGENIFAGSGKAWSGLDAVASWVSEQQYYDYNSNTCANGQVCGHYTQVVWANSVSIGCARVMCNTGGYFITCNYNPPGNYLGQWPYGSN
nr:pathogenesis-related protein 1g [Allium sativum]QYF06694.1 pathogenesis-related protein 1g [Allium sativum]